MFGDFWRLFGDRLSGGEKVSKQALCGRARGRAPERAGGGAERPRMAQIGAQIRGSGQPARRPFRCQGGCLEDHHQCQTGSDGRGKDIVQQSL
eukprot:COSAG06_NODE_7616_length_2438_cov_1.542540_1_plen_93_part_00